MQTTMFSLRLNFIIFQGMFCFAERSRAGETAAAAAPFPSRHSAAAAAPARLLPTLAAAAAASDAASHPGQSAGHSARRAAQNSRT